MENDFDQFVIENLFDENEDYPNNKDVSLVLMSIKNISDASNCTEPHVWEWDVRHLPYVGKRPPTSMSDMETLDILKVAAFFFLSLFSLCGNGVVVVLMVRKWKVQQPSVRRTNHRFQCALFSTSTSSMYVLKGPPAIKL